MTVLGTTGSFLLVMIDTDPAAIAPHVVANDQFELKLNGAAGVEVTALSTETGTTPTSMRPRWITYGRCPSTWH